VKKLTDTSNAVVFPIKHIKMIQHGCRSTSTSINIHHHSSTLININQNPNAMVSEHPFFGVSEHLERPRSIFAEGDRVRVTGLKAPSCWPLVMLVFYPLVGHFSKHTLWL